MSRRARWILRIGVGLGLMAITVWWFRIPLLLAGIDLAMTLRVSVGPHRTIDWDRGSDREERPAGERPPNIVLILADDLGWNDLTLGGGGVAGGTVPTPHIDSIARQGVRFGTGYAANGTCAPSRAALMTGRYGTRFGFEFTPTPPGMGRMVGMILGDTPGKLRMPVEPEGATTVDYDDMGMRASEITLAELLKRAGYHTVHIGKWHLGRANGMAPHEQGFDESLLMVSGLYLPEDDPGVVNSKQDFDPIDRFLWAALEYAASFNGGENFAPGGYLTDYYTDEAVEVIAANKDRPFFLYLAHWAPHTPLQATREDYDALSHIPSHRERVYAAMIRALDRGIGRVLGALRDNGLEENTLVLFTSDNGGANYIGLPDVNRPYRGWKLTFYEGGIRVPFFAKWPRRLPAGATYDRPVHHFDLFTTAAAAAGVPVPDDRPIDGVDLVPFVLGERTGDPHAALFWRSGHYRVVLADGWKLQVNGRSPSPRLFHVRDDPTEQVDLARAEPARVAQLQALLDAHDAEQEPSAWPSSAEMPVNVDKTLIEPDAPADEYVYWPN